MRNRQVAPPRGRQQRVRREEIDVHELLKQEALNSPGPGVRGCERKYGHCKEKQYGISDQYIVLDSFTKVRKSNISRGEYQWNFMVQGETDYNNLGVRDVIDNVIEIQIGTFTIPILPDVAYELKASPGAPTGLDQLVLIHNNTTAASGAPTLVPNAAPYGQYPPHTVLTGGATASPWVHNPYTQLAHNGNFTIQLREAGLQSYSDRNGRHHFEYTVSHPSDTNPNTLLATPISGSMWDTFTFSTPLSSVHGLTLIFRNPDNPIKFEPDCVYDVTIDTDGAIEPGPYLRINVGADHNLAAGDRVYVTRFASGNAKLDAYMNRLDGHVIGGDPAAPLAPGVIVDGDYVWLDPAVSIIDLTVTVPTLPQIVNLFIAKRRIRIPFRFRRLLPKLTNHISP